MHGSRGTRAPRANRRQHWTRGCGVVRRAGGGVRGARPVARRRRSGRRGRGRTSRHAGGSAWPCAPPRPVLPGQLPTQSPLGGAAPGGLHARWPAGAREAPRHLTGPLPGLPPAARLAASALPHPVPQLHSLSVAPPSPPSGGEHTPWACTAPAHEDGNAPLLSPPPPSLPPRAHTGSCRPRGSRRRRAGSSRRRRARGGPPARSREAAPPPAAASQRSELRARGGGGRRYRRGTRAQAEALGQCKHQQGKPQQEEEKGEEQSVENRRRRRSRRGERGRGECGAPRRSR
jgi:hypothetical protein